MGNPTIAPTVLPVASSTPLVQTSIAANTFTYGAPPESNVASSSDPARIYYVTLTPTVLTYGQAVTITAITSTNVVQLSLAYNGVSLSLLESAPGQWQATLPFTLIGNPTPPGPITLSLIASKADGSQMSIPIPVTIAQQ
jgi:hypothetical protein